MMPIRPLALGLALLAGVLALGAPAADVDPRLVTQAATFVDYMRQAAQISPAFGGPDAVANSLRVGVAYEPQQFRHGAVAYAAIAALQDATFVAAVRAAGQTPDQRYAIVR